MPSCCAVCTFKRMNTKKGIYCSEGKDIKMKTLNHTHKGVASNGVLKSHPIARTHKDKKAQKLWKYFKSSTYKKKTKHLKQFLVEYAKDSGNVPACN